MSNTNREDNANIVENQHRQAATMPHRTVRQVYLLTYSQADEDKFPIRASFANAVVNAFQNCPAQLQQWVCSMEKHRNGGTHFHMAVKMDRNVRWLQLKNALEEQHGIIVHFSCAHYNYYTAWRYVTKEDRYFIESEGHPNLRNTGAPRTDAACRRHHNANTDDNTTNAVQQPAQVQRNKKKRLSAFDVSQIVVEHNIKTRTELLALANEQKEEGKCDLAEFIVNRGPRVVAQVLDTAWELETANETLQRQNKTRLDILQDTLQQPCDASCNGRWLHMACQILERNGINREAFTQSIKVLLEKGRGKNRNILIVGPANCGKTFILNPLTKIYKVFLNPATATFAWVGAELAECIFLNDFRWSDQVITWHDFLLMLEGQLVHLPAPKTHYSQDILFDKDTPIFCTSKVPFVYIKRGVVDDRETEMMSVRWRVFTFNYQIAQHEQVEMAPCAHCFAQLILLT